MLALRGWLEWVGPLPGDRDAAAHYSPAHPGLPHWVIDAYVTLARPWCVLVTLVVAMAILGWRVGTPAALGLLLAEFVIVWNAVLKTIFGATPLWSSLHASGVNYPSGHASYVAAVFGYLAWIGGARHRPEVVGAALVVIVGMGAERVLSGTHLLSDVIGGYLLGVSWLLPVTAWVRGGWSDAPRARPVHGSGL